MLSASSASSQLPTSQPSLATKSSTPVTKGQSPTPNKPQEAAPQSSVPPRIVPSNLGGVLSSTQGSNLSQEAREQTTGPSKVRFLFRV